MRGESSIAATRNQKKRSPLKNPPLRNPGESLDQEIQRVLNDRAAPAFMAAAIAIVFAAYEWIRSFVSMPPQPIITSFVALLAVAYAAYTYVKLRRQISSLRLGLEGEKSVGQFLEANRKPGWHVLHDIPGTGFNVDHVLITPHGVFAIETKTFSKPPRANASVEFDGERISVDGFEPDRNPVAQARAVRDWVRDLLYDTTGIRYPVRGVVVLPGWYVRGPKDRGSNDVWVLNPKALPSFIEHERIQVPDEDVALAYSRLSNYITNQQRSGSA